MWKEDSDRIGSLSTSIPIYRCNCGSIEKVQQHYRCFMKMFLKLLLIIIVFIYST